MQRIYHLLGRTHGQYTRSASLEQAFLISASLLEGNAHEWWIVHSHIEDERNITTWQGFNEALVKHF